MPFPLVRLYTDGGSRGNPGPSAIGIVVCFANDSTIVEYKEHIGDATSNEAEYRALITGLDMAAAHTRKEVLCTLDSQLVVRHMTGVYGLRQANMKTLFAEVKDKAQMFEKVGYRHQPRLTGQLKRADELVNEALDEAGF